MSECIRDKKWFGEAQNMVYKVVDELKSNSENGSPIYKFIYYNNHHGPHDELVTKEYFLNIRENFVTSTPHRLLKINHNEMKGLQDFLLDGIYKGHEQFFNVFLDVEKIGNEEVISAEPFKKLVRSLLELAQYYLERRENRDMWWEHMTTEGIFFYAGVYTMRYISMQTINIHFKDINGCDITKEEVFPFTSVEYLEHYLYETFYVKRGYTDYTYKEWNSSGNKVKLYIGDKELPSKMTLYEAVLKYGLVIDEIYATEYVILVKRFDTLKEPEEDLKEGRGSIWDGIILKRFFDLGMTDRILWVLDLLYRMNRFGSRLVGRETLIDNKEFVFPELDKLVAKTLYDPFNALCGNFPEWIEIVNSYPYLLSFDTRKLAFEVLGSDRLRAATAVLNKHSIFKEAFSLDSRFPLVNINKLYVLDQVKNTLHHTRPYSQWNSAYDSQMGTGVGVQQDLCTTVAQNLMQANLKLWAASKDEVTKSGYLRTEAGLYPDYNMGVRKKDVLDFKDCSQDVKFEIIGAFMAKAILNRMIFPLPLSQTVFKWLLQEEGQLCVDDLKYVDPSYYKILNMIQDQEDAMKISERVSLDPDLKQALLNRIPVDGLDGSIDDYYLTFVLPRHDIELIPDGKNIFVTNENAISYKNKMIDFILKSGVEDSMIAMRRGFNRIIKLKYLRMFEPSELLGMMCGVEDSQFWTFDHFTANIQLTNFPINCPEILETFDIISKMTNDEKRRFLHFVTGCPYLPPNGFAGLEPRFHIVRTERHRSPYVQTCFNRIYLPAGIQKEKLRKFYYLGITEGYQFFGLA